MHGSGNGLLNAQLGFDIGTLEPAPLLADLFWRGTGVPMGSLSLEHRRRFGMVSLDSPLARVR